MTVLGLQPGRFTARDMLAGVSTSTRFRELVRALLEEKGLDQTYLAARLGRTQGGVSQLLSGARRGNVLDLLEQVAHALDVPLSELIRRSESSDLPRHGSPVDSSDIAQIQSLSSLKDELDAGISAPHTDQSPGRVGDGTDPGSTTQIVAAFDARLDRFEQRFTDIAEQFRRRLIDLDHDIWLVKALAEDFSEQAAQLRTAPDQLQHAASGALGTGVPEVSGEHLKQAGRKGRGTKHPRLRPGHDAAGE